MVYPRVKLPLIVGVSLFLLIVSALRADVDPADSLSVMTVNMWHKDSPRQLRVMADRMRSDMDKLPDFVLCQEVVFERRDLRENTAEVLADYLGGYHTRGTKRTSDREGLAILSKYPFVHYAERHLKSQTARLLLGFNRVSVMGEFMVPGVGRVRVVNVHFTNWAFEHGVRERQLRETLEWIAGREAEAPAAVTFLGGDFNARAHWDEMRLIANSEWHAKLDFLNFNSNEPSMGTPGDPHQRIDYIFVAAPGRQVKLAEERLFWKEGLRDGGRRFFLSDHLCVLHDYRVASGTASASVQ